MLARQQEKGAKTDSILGVVLGLGDKVREGHCGVFARTHQFVLFCSRACYWRSGHSPFWVLTCGSRLGELKSIKKVRVAALLWGMDVVIRRGAVGVQAMRLFQFRNILLLENLM
ncbi:hypothetical protein AK972_3723 [Pseudomonas yamanorum]|nr:hypothetical protein AK972_3723 [Pseudomonas yamanorum]